MAADLPEYDRPPIVEVALSWQFDRLETAAPQLALAWTRFRDRFPRVEERLELEPSFERFDPAARQASSIRFQVGTLPATRFWFLDASGSELLQIQRDRFVRNWRKTEQHSDYPRYSNLRASFVRDWELFSEYVSEEFGTTLVPNQCEVTYVNIVPIANPGRLDDILACVSGTYSDAYLNEPEATELRTRFVLRDEAGQPWGRLHVTAMPAEHSTDQQALVRLILTARGKPATPDTAGGLRSLDLGHEAVVRGFTSITTPEMHKHWGRKR